MPTNNYAMAALLAGSGWVLRRIRKANARGLSRPAPQFSTDAFAPLEPRVLLSSTALLPAVSPAFGVATQLAVVQQPTTATAGQTFTPTLTIDVEDATGNLVTTDNSTITLQIVAGPNGAAINGTTTAQAVNGVATFGGLSLNVAGSYTIEGDDGTLTPADANLTVNPGPATQLVIGQQPTSVAAGQTFSPALVVGVEDAFGNLVTTDNSTVSLAIAGGPAGAVINGTHVVQAVNGVATFDSISLGIVGSYDIEADDGALTAVRAAITITPAAAKLVIVQQPATATAGQPFTPTLTVDVEDAQGNIVTDDNSSVGLGIDTGPGGFTGTTVVQTVNGVATFDGLSLNVAGAYTFEADDSAGSAVTPAQANLTVSPGAAAQLVFGTQPSDTSTGATVTPPVTVDVDDAFGNIITTDTSTVVLAIATGPTGGTLGGTTTVQAVNGVATFSTLSFSAAGTYTLQAADSTEPALTPATSNSVIVGEPVAAAGANGTAINNGATTTSTSNDTDFGLTPEGTPADESFIVVNQGTVPLTLGTPTVPTGFTLVTPPAASVPAGGSTQFTVQFTAATLGPVSGTVSFSTNDPNNNPYTFAISGTATPPNDGGLGGTLGLVGTDDDGTIVTDGLGNVTGGTLMQANGSQTTITGGSYSVGGPGNTSAGGAVTLSITGAPANATAGSIFNYSGTGTLSDAQEIAALTNTDLAASTDTGLTVLVNPGTTAFTGANIATTWDFTSATARGTVIFDQTGHVLGGNLITAAHPLGQNITGGTYTLSATGTIQFTLNFPSPSSPSSLSYAGQEDAFNDTMVVDDATLGQPGSTDASMAVLTVPSGNASNGDGAGTWTFAGSTMAGSISLDGKGHVTAGSITLGGYYLVNAVTGTYSVTAAGALKLSLVLTPPGSGPSQALTFTGSINGSNNIVALSSTTLSGTGPATEGLVVMVDATLNIATIPNGSFTSNSPVPKGQPIILTASNVSINAPGQIRTVDFYEDTLGTGVFNAAHDKFVGTGKLTGGATYTLTISTSAKAFLQGKYTYFAVPVDTFGRQGAPAPETVTVDVDDAAPAIKKLVVAAPAHPSANNLITLTASGVTDVNLNKEKVASVDFYWDPTGTGTLTNAILLGVAKLGSGWTARVILPTTSGTPAFPTTGTAMFLAQAINTVGTPGNIVSTTATIIAQPVITGVTVTPTLVGLKQTLTITVPHGDISDPSGTVTKVQFWAAPFGSTSLDTTTDVFLGAGVLQPNGDWVLTIKSLTQLPLADYTIFARAVDSLGTLSDPTGTTLVVEQGG